MQKRSSSKTGPNQTERLDQTRQLLLGENWWTSRFLGTLNHFCNPKELVKGRRLAEKGFVRRIEVISCGIRGLVADDVVSSAVVYVWIDELNDQEWNQVIRILATESSLFIRMVAGDMAEDLYERLKDVSVSIIPSALEMECICECDSDHTICRHAIALITTLGKEINEDPMLLFLLRGMEQEVLIKRVQQKRDVCESDDKMEATIKESDEQYKGDLGSVHKDRFYSPGPELDEISFAFPTESGSELKCIEWLGTSPFRLGDADLAVYIAQIYGHAASFVRTMRGSSDEDKSVV